MDSVQDIRFPLAQRQLCVSVPVGPAYDPRRLLSLFSEKGMPLRLRTARLLDTMATPRSSGVLPSSVSKNNLNEEIHYEEDERSLRSRPTAVTAVFKLGKAGAQALPPNSQEQDEDQDLIEGAVTLDSEED